MPGHQATGGSPPSWPAASPPSYLSTAKDRHAASTYVLASDNLDVHLDGAGWLMDRDDLGDVRFAVESRAGSTRLTVQPSGASGPV